MEYENLQNDLIEDYKAIKEKIQQNKYKNIEKKMNNSFTFKDLLTEKQRKQIMKYISE